MPGVLSPELAARMELILTAGVVGAVDDKSELTAETELIASQLCRRLHKLLASFRIWIVDPESEDLAANVQRSLD
jgi:hypothetical protein